MTAALGRLGRFTLGVVARAGDLLLLALQALGLGLRPPWRLRPFVEQLHAVGVGSLVVIAVTGAFTGMVLALQGYYTLSKFGSESLLGAGVALSIIRELGPVLGAFMLIGRAGSAITAEIGVMRVTEQIDALSMMAVNPKARVVLPRLVATTLALPVLVAIFDAVGILAGYVVGVDLLGVNPGAFWAEIQAKTTGEDLNEGWLKAVVFGFLVGAICTWMGWRARPTTEGVAAATTHAVVLASLAVLVADYIMTSFFL